MATKSNRSAAVILIAVLVLLVVYPLSAGPAYALCESPEGLWDTIYAPIG